MKATKGSAAPRPSSAAKYGFPVVRVPWIQQLTAAFPARTTRIVEKFTTGPMVWPKCQLLWPTAHRRISTGNHWQIFTIPRRGGDTGHVRRNSDPVRRKSVCHVRVPQSGQIRQWTTLPRRDLETVTEKLWHQAPKAHPSLISSQRTSGKPKQDTHESDLSCRCRRAQLETRTVQVPSNLPMHLTHQHTVYPISSPISPGP